MVLNARNALFRGALDKGCTDIMYMTIEYPNYPKISLLTQPPLGCVRREIIGMFAYSIALYMISVQPLSKAPLQRVSFIRR